LRNLTLKWLSTFTTLSVLLGLAETASAFWACQQTTITIRNLGGGWCDNSSGSGSDCDGYTYLRTIEFDKNRPIDGVRVMLQNEDGDVIDDGVTDSNGRATLCTDQDIDLKVVWFPESDDGRLLVKNASGGRHRFFTGLFRMFEGATLSATFQWGNSATAHPEGHAYYGARRLWTHSLDNSGRLINVYTNVRIHAEHTKCATSCADRKEIWLNPGSARQFQARILHEMGHTVADLASEDSYIGPDDSNKTAGLAADGGWDNTSIEKRGVALNEAFATFVGATALMDHSTDVPLQCSTNVNCADTRDNNMETPPRCSDSERRHSDILDYLWDLWDQGDTVDVNFFSYPDTMKEFQNGLVNRNKSEHWECHFWICTVESQNLRDVWDWEFNFETNTGVNTNTEKAAACL
jgi:hypothetical protein